MNPIIDPVVKACNCLITFGIKPTRMSIKSLPQGLFLVLKFKGNAHRIFRIQIAIELSLNQRYPGKYTVEKIANTILVSLKKG